MLEDLVEGSDAFVDTVASFAFDLIESGCTSSKFANAIRYAAHEGLLPELPLMVVGIHLTSYPDDTMRLACFHGGFTREAEHTFPRFPVALQAKSHLSFPFPGFAFAPL